MHSEAWSWVTNPRFPSFCLIFIHSKSPNRVLEAYGADTESAVSLTDRESITAFPKAEYLFRVGVLQDWIFCYEDRKLLGVTRGVQEALSRESKTIRLFKGGDGMRTVERMENCRRIEYFEPDRPSDVRGEGPFVLSELVREELSAAHPNAMGMSVVGSVLTKQFGLKLDWKTLEGPLITASLREG